MLSVKKLLYKVLTNLSIITVVFEQTATVSNGYFVLTPPSGIRLADTMLIIQPMYVSNGLIGWTATIQIQSNNTANVYVRTGSTTPPSGTARYNAVFIKR